jgi:hypothetical protein
VAPSPCPMPQRARLTQERSGAFCSGAASGARRGRGRRCYW